MKTQKPLLAINIAKRRKALGMNQDDLAARVGVHVNTIKNIERGLSEGHLDTREHIANVLGCELWELTGPQKEPAKTNSGSVSDLILAIQGRLTTLNESELSRVSMFIDDLADLRSIIETDTKSASNE